MTGSLGGDHPAVAKFLDYWACMLKEQVEKEDADSDESESEEDEVTKRRKELEKKSQLNADQLTKFASVLSPAAEQVDSETGIRFFFCIG